MQEDNRQAGQAPKKRYLHMASATEESIDAFIDALLSDLDENRLEPEEVVKKTMLAHQVDPSQIKHLWTQKVKTRSHEGVLAVVQLDGGAWFAVISCPQIPLTEGEKILKPEGLTDLLALSEGVSPDRITIREGFLHYSDCHPLELKDEEDIPHAFRRLRNLMQKVRNSLMMAFMRTFGASDEDVAKTIFLPILPDIRLSDEDAERIHNFLLRADQRARDLFVDLMEAWDGLGYYVGTTPQSMVLDAPYGTAGGKVRLAILQPGQSQNVVEFFKDEGYEEISPAIILRWHSLRQQAGIPAEAFAAYEEMLTNTLNLRLTPSSAHVQDVLALDKGAGEHLIAAMAALARSIDHAAVKPKQSSPRVTPNRVQASLGLCDPQVRACFERLLGAWQVIEGTVQCSKIGRIYLKMHTRAHGVGDRARLARRFNLLTLVCPQQGKQAAIQVAWGLADADKPSAFLDYIPDAVASFEEAVSGMPGFEVKGSVTRILIDETFTSAQLDQLVHVVMQLKAKEKAAS